jgi:hypothetical protein
MNRAKTDFDPLSFFVHESEHKPEEPEEEEEPVIPQKKTVTIKQVEYSKPTTNYNSSETLRPAAVKEVPKSNVSNTKQTHHQPVKEAPPVDVLFSDEYNRKTELLLSTEEDLFKSEENSPKPTKVDILPSSTTTIFSKTSKPSTSSGTTIDYRKRADDDISDLRVAKLLEKEEGLDESIFGSSTVSSIQQNKIIQKKKLASTNNELENESNFLKELDEITIGSKPKYTSTLSKSGDSYSSSTNKPSSTTDTQEKKVNLDLDSLDINSYINQEASSSGGGLFDD